MAVQIIDGDGTFRSVELESFIEEVKLGPCGVSYALVSIIGPQSSGKSTLLNHLFNTKFQEMDAYSGRSQTTRGVWLAKAVGIDPFTLVMDLEGSDGEERGDDKLFEKQSVLFALSISDVVIINMWCHDIGRDSAASTSLLEIVFEAMNHMFKPRRTTLMFVIRDKTKQTPLPELEKKLRTSIEKIWDSAPKSKAHRKTHLSEFFRVEVAALPNYEDQKDQFEEEVASLRRRFFNSIKPGGLAGDRSGTIASTRFAVNASEVWKNIKDNKDLDLPAHKIVVSKVRCKAIAAKIYSGFTTSEEWPQMKESGFKEKLEMHINKCLEKYDSETIYFDNDVRSKKRKKLEGKLHKAAQEAKDEYWREFIYDAAQDALLELLVKLGSVMGSLEAVALYYLLFMLRRVINHEGLDPKFSHLDRKMGDAVAAFHAFIANDVDESVRTASSDFHCELSAAVQLLLDNDLGESLSTVFSILHRKLHAARFSPGVDFISKLLELLNNGIGESSHTNGPDFFHFPSSDVVNPSDCITNKLVKVKLQNNGGGESSHANDSNLHHHLLSAVGVNRVKRYISNKPAKSQKNKGRGESSHTNDSKLHHHLLTMAKVNRVKRYITNKLVKRQKNKGRGESSYTNDPDLPRDPSAAVVNPGGDLTAELQELLNDGSGESSQTNDAVAFRIFLGQLLERLNNDGGENRRTDEYELAQEPSSKPWMMPNP